ncbi:MAG: hypothetical protein MMC33_000201 [Icmadophila ericetorum]|nr:hypothetical protein [Icmadophila ericetorum]
MENRMILSRKSYEPLVARHSLSDDASTPFSTVNDSQKRRPRLPSSNSYLSLSAALLELSLKGYEYTEGFSAVNRVIGQSIDSEIEAPLDAASQNLLSAEISLLPNHTPLLSPTQSFPFQVFHHHKLELEQEKHSGPPKLNRKKALVQSKRHHSAPILVLYVRHTGLNPSSSCQSEANLQDPDNISNSNEPKRPTSNPVRSQTFCQNLTPNPPDHAFHSQHVQDQSSNNPEVLQSSHGISLETPVEDRVQTGRLPDHATSAKMSSTSKNPFRRRPRSQSEKAEKQPKATFNDLASAYISIRGGAPTGFSKSSPINTSLPSPPSASYQRPAGRRSHSFSVHTLDISPSERKALAPLSQIGSLDSHLHSESGSPVKEKAGIPPSKFHMSWSAFAAAHPHLTKEELIKIKAAWPDLSPEYFGTVNKLTPESPRRSDSHSLGSRRRSASLRALDFPSQFNECLSDPFVERNSGSSTRRSHMSNKIPPSPGVDASEVFVSSPLHQVTTLEHELAALDSSPRESGFYDWSPRPSDEVIGAMSRQPRTPRIPHNIPIMPPTMPPNLSLPPSPPSDVPRHGPLINVHPSFTTFERSDSYGQTRNLLELDSSSPHMPRGTSNGTHSFLSSGLQLGTSSDESRNENLRPHNNLQRDLEQNSSTRSLARVSWVSSDGSRSSRMLSDQETKELQSRIRQGLELENRLSSKRSSNEEATFGFYTEEFQHTGSLSVSYPEEEVESSINRESNDSVVHCMGPAGHRCDASCPYMISLRTQEARRVARTYEGPSQDTVPHSNSLEHKLSEEIEDDDWITEALSQPAGFQERGVQAKFAGSSIADTSDPGNLSPPRRRPLRLRSPLVHPAHPRYAHTYSVLKDKKSGEDVLVPEYKYGGAAFPYRNVATTPLANASKYQHPAPLSKEHTNPFTSSPPSLDSTNWRADNLHQPLSPTADCSMVAHDSRSCVGERFVAHRGRPLYQSPFSRMAMKDGERDISHSSFQGFGADTLNTKGWFQQAYDGPLNKDHNIPAANSREHGVSPEPGTGLMEASIRGIKRDTGSSLADNSNLGSQFSNSSAHQATSPIANSSRFLGTPTAIAVRQAAFNHSPVSPCSQPWPRNLRSPQSLTLVTPEKPGTNALPPNAAQTMKTPKSLHRRTHDGISGSIDSTADEFFERIRNHPIHRDSSIYEEDYEYDLDQVSPIASGFTSSDLDRHRRDLVEHSLLQRDPSPVKKRRHTAPLEKFTIEEPPATYHGRKKVASPCETDFTLDRANWDRQLKTRSIACRQKVQERMAAIDNQQYYTVNETSPVPLSPTTRTTETDYKNPPYRAVVQPDDMEDQVMMEAWVNFRAATDPSPAQVELDRKMNDTLRDTRGPPIALPTSHRPHEEIAEAGRISARAESPHLYPSLRQLRENRAKELNDRQHTFSGLFFCLAFVFPPFALIYGHGFADGIMAIYTNGELPGFHETWKKLAVWYGWGSCTAIFALTIFFFVCYSSF